MWIGQYILDENGTPVPEPDTIKWGMWLEGSSKSSGKDNRIVRQDRFGEIFVSTVFLGLDQYYCLERDVPHEPVLWETMICVGKHDRHFWRYTSREAADAGHLEALALIEAWKLDIDELNRMLALKPEWEKR